MCIRDRAEARRAPRRTGPAPAATEKASSGEQKKASDSDFLQREGGIY